MMTAARALIDADYDVVVIGGGIPAETVAAMAVLADTARRDPKPATLPRLSACIRISP